MTGSLLWKYLFQGGLANSSGETIQFATGSFTKSTGGAPASQSVTGLGFEPKALILFSTQTTADDSITSHLEMAIGFSDGTNEKSMWGGSESLVATSDADRFSNSTKLLTLRDITSATSGDLLAECDLTSFDSDGFTINWTTNNAVATKIKFIAYGGDITVEVGSFTQPGSTGTQNVATSLDTADFVLTLSAEVNTEDSLSTHAAITIGAATSSSNEGTAAIFDFDALSTTDGYRYQRTDRCNSIISTSLLAQSEFTGFTSSGFDLNWTNISGSGRVFYYLTIKGGQWEVGNGNTPTSTGTQPYTTAFKPKGLGLFGFTRSATASISSHSTLVFGAADETNETCISISSQDALSAVSFTHRNSSNTSCYSPISTSGSGPTHVATLDSFNDTDFTLDFTTVQASLFQFLWWICGDSS